MFRKAGITILSEAYPVVTRHHMNNTDLVEVHVIMRGTVMYYAWYYREAWEQWRAFNQKGAIEILLNREGPREIDLRLFLQTDRNGSRKHRIHDGNGTHPCI